ncbi:hypothetical protein EMIHUDRAFT_455955, partial [Emiliania huxleyi CCMP1516]|uniref:asparaginase n=2 Tax=Emiliania huxleyi TaxID=2903 RepID=A0A0D3KAI5_EMIH1
MPAPSSPNAATALTKPRAGGMPMRRVLVLNCGGTIGMQDTAHGYACGPPGFLSGICRSVPMIHDPAFDLAPHLDAVDAASRGDMLVTPVGEFGTRTLFRIVDYDPLLDSSNMTEKEWVRIASDIAAAYDAWDAFVASSRGLVIVNVTQCSAGSVEPAYATGQSLAAAGVVAGGDMTPEAALVKLGWLLGCGLAPEEVRRMMGTDLRGEVTNRQAQRFSLSDGGFLRRVFSAASLESVAQADPSAAAPPPSSLAEGEARLQETSPLDGLLAEGGKEALRDGLSRAASAPHSLDGGLADYSGLPALRRALVPTLLCAAAGNGDMQAMLALVADGAVLRTSRDYDGRTPLHLASSEGRDAVVAYLLQPEHGIPLSALDRHDNTPLADAC